MPIDQSNIYFSATGTNVRGEFVIVFHHAATGIALTMTEALQIDGLPEGMTLRAHPGLPGRAAWAVEIHILQITMRLRRAGFAASVEELAAPREMPPIPEPRQSHIVQLAPGIILDTSGISNTGGPREPNKREDIAYNVKTRFENGSPVTEVAFALTYDEYPEDSPEELSRFELEEDGFWADISEVIAKNETDNWRWRCNRSELEVIAALDAKGFKRCTRVFMWFDPSELEFGIAHEGEGYGDDGEMHIFIIPIDEDAPYFDDLRGEHLPQVPPYFDDNLCENTFSIRKGTNRDAVIADMKARGYTHNPEHDGAAGG